MVVRRCVLAFVLSFVVSGASSVSASDLPSFSDYPATKAWNGNAARLLQNSRFAKNYRTRLRDIAGGPANFAGHYAVGSWGCGTGGCFDGGVVDLNTGQATPFPQTTIQSSDIPIPADAGVHYRPDSDLMVFVGIANEDGPSSANFYRFDGREFRLIHSEPIEASGPPLESRAANFHGYACTVDCSGHDAGYRWASDNMIHDVADCTSASRSFSEGCMAYVDEQQ